MPALLTVAFSLRQQKLHTSWKAMRSQWLNLSGRWTRYLANIC